MGILHLGSMFSSSAHCAQRSRNIVACTVKLKRNAIPEGDWQPPPIGRTTPVKFSTLPPGQIPPSKKVTGYQPHTGISTSDRISECRIFLIHPLHDAPGILFFLKQLRFRHGRNPLYLQLARKWVSQRKPGSLHR